MKNELAQQSNVVPLHPAQPSMSAHLACGKCGTIAEVKCDCGVDYVYVHASERAEKAIMENPEMSDRVIAEAAGVSKMTVNRARKLAATNGATEKHTGKDGKKYQARKCSTTAVPEGYGTLSEAILAGLEVEHLGGGLEKAEAKSGLSHSAYFKGRDIVLLSLRTDLTTKDAETVKLALQQLNDIRNVSAARSSVRSIADRIWGRKGTRLKSEKIRMEAFSSALSYLLTVCTGAAELTIPYLSKEQTDSALENIKEAKQALDVLRRRIRKGDSEYHE